MKKIFLSASVLVFVTACTQKGKDYNQMAVEMCGCFNKLKDSIPAEAMTVFNEAAAAPQAGEAYRNGVAKLPAELVIKLNNALLSFSKPGSGTKECLENMDKKYKAIGGEKNEVTQKLIEALKGNKDCTLMITMMRMEQEKITK